MTSVCTDPPLLWIGVLLPTAIVGSVVGYYLQFKYLEATAPYSEYFIEMREEQERADTMKWGFHLPNIGWVSWSCAMRRPIGAFLTTGTALAIIVVSPICFSQFPVVGIAVTLGTWILLVQWTHWRNSEHKYDAGFLLSFALATEIIITAVNLSYLYTPGVWATLLALNIFLALMFLNHPLWVYLVNRYTKDELKRAMARAVDSTLLAVEIGNLLVFSAQTILVR